MEIGQTVAEVWRFSIIQNGGRRHLGFLKFGNFEGWNGQEDRNASSGQIS